MTTTSLDNATAHAPVSNEPDEPDAIDPMLSEPFIPADAGAGVTGDAEDVDRARGLESTVDETWGGLT